MIELLKNNNFVLRIIILLGFSAGFWSIGYSINIPLNYHTLPVFLSSLILIFTWDLHVKYIEFKIKFGASLLLLGALTLLYYLYHTQFNVKSLYVVSAFYLSMVFLNRLEQKNRKSVDQLFLSGVLLSIPIFYYPEYIFIWLFPFILLLVFKIKNYKAWISPFIAYLFVAIYYLSFLFLTDQNITFNIDYSLFTVQLTFPWILLSIINGLFALYYFMQMTKFGVKERLHAQVHIISSILLFIMCLFLNEFHFGLMLSLNFYILPLSLIKQSKYWKTYFFMLVLSYAALYILFGLDWI